MIRLAGITSLAYGGSLIVTTSPACFRLEIASRSFGANSYAGSFASMTLLTLSAALRGHHNLSVTARLRSSIRHPASYTSQPKSNHHESNSAGFNIHRAGVQAYPTNGKKLDPHPHWRPVELLDCSSDYE